MSGFWDQSQANRCVLVKVVFSFLRKIVDLIKKSLHFIWNVCHLKPVKSRNSKVTKIEYSLDLVNCIRFSQQKWWPTKIVWVHIVLKITKCIFHVSSIFYLWDPFHLWNCFLMNFKPISRSHFFYYGKTWNGKKYPFANVKMILPFHIAFFYHLNFFCHWRSFFCYCFHSC